MGKDYNISKHGGHCCRCEKPFEPGAAIVTTIWEDDEDFLRKDFCAECWDADAAEDEAKPFGVWRTKVPTPQEKKKLFIDDELLVNFFERLADEQEPARINFRFVLALVLMRKRLLIYDRSDTDADGGELWTMHLRGDDRKHMVVNPKMDEEQTAEVSEKLGEILEGQL